MSHVVKFLVIFFGCLWFLSCGSDNSADTGLAAHKIREICVAQKKFFNKTNRFGTLSELHSEGLVTDDTRNHQNILDKEFHGYIFEVNPTQKGYTAKANPVGYEKNKSPGQTSFYVDENSKIIKAAYEGVEAGPNSPDYQASENLGKTTKFSCEE